MRKRKTQRTGFTLLEIILYTGVSALVLILVMGITWDFMQTQKRSRVYSEILQTGENLLQKITTDIHEADDLDEGFSIFNDPGSLSLTNGLNQILIETYLKQINVGGENLTIRKVRRTQDSDSFDLTKDNVNITSFLLEDLSRDQNSHNINIVLELEYIGTANESLDLDPIQLERSVSIRNK